MTILLLPYLAACFWISPDAHEALLASLQDSADGGPCTIEWYRDADGDGFGAPDAVTTACELPEGFSPYALDCDDSNQSVNPDAAEACDGIDDNCDGIIDESGDPVLWYADEDADGFGSSLEASLACAQPEQTSRVAGDCDDLNANANPSMAEVCDGLDNDCDGAIDDDDDNVILSSGTEFAYDGDGDGFGDPGITAEACVEPAGYVVDATDCDDDDPAIYPWAADASDDGVDSDCGGTDAADADADGDGHNDEAIGGTDCDDDDPAVHPGAEEDWYDGADADCDGESDFDADADGADSEVYGGTDCDDGDANRYPGAPETWYDGIDGNCDGASDDDWDGDGYAATSSGGDDCDDLDAGSYAAFGSCAPSCADDATAWQVPGDYPTIQDAIAGAAVGDSVCVAAGTYFENLNLLGKDIVLQGAAGSAATIVNGGGLGAGLTAETGESTAARIEGFTFTGGASANGGGIYVDTSGLSLVDVVVTDNAATTYGGGLYAIEAELSLTAVYVIGNFAGVSGGGAWFQGSEVGWVGGRVAANQADGSYGGGLAWYAGSYGALSGVDIVDNHLDTATTSNGGGGVYSYQSELYLTNAAVISNSTSGRGGGWYSNSDAAGNATNVSFVGNEALNGGAGFVYATASGGTLVNVVLHSDYASSDVDGFFDYSETMVATYSDLDESCRSSDNNHVLAEGAGNVVVDPAFITYSATLDPSRWDLHLRLGSGLIDAGDPSIVDGDGSRSDIGAHAGAAADVTWYGDRDGDAMFDGWELDHGLDPTTPDSAIDADGDGLTNAAELEAGTYPEESDTDGDGTSDGDEVAAGDDPLAP